jgi:enoyl-CoA hydratase/carnithine racemase
MGEKIANEMLFKNKKLGAKEAKSCGFVTEVCTSDSVLTHSLDHCIKLLQSPDKLKRKIHANSREEAIILKSVNHQELSICERSWICEGSFRALSNFLFSRKMYLPGIVLRYSLIHVTHIYIYI